MPATAMINQPAVAPKAATPKTTNLRQDASGNDDRFTPALQQACTDVDKGEEIAGATMVSQDVVTQESIPTKADGFALSEFAQGESVAPDKLVAPEKLVTPDSAVVMAEKSVVKAAGEESLVTQPKIEVTIPALDNKEVNPQAIRSAKQAVATQAVATQAVATQAVATQAVATQAVATQAVATQAVATQAVATQAVATQAVATQA
ncbi:MAG: hypothetical protein U9R29_05750, partial [Thermodesulfobacteriota bacterium]|nr:hypothetical protein [Thermodesulfobacteriota bacterium]